MNRFFVIAFSTAAAWSTGLAADVSSIDLGSNLKLEVVAIPAGTFQMGSPEGSLGAANDEWMRNPKADGYQRTVTLTKPFQMGVTEVTQEQYQQVMGSNPSVFKNPKSPVENVSWSDAVKFCELLSSKTGKTVRLPTEAEWEYACRAGSSTRYHYGEDPDTTSLAEYAWYEDNSDRATHPAGQKKPNAWGLHDMIGNVWEWCLDYHKGPYEEKSATDPKGPSTATDTRVLRGGCWESRSLSARSANRGGVQPDRANSRLGFRIVVENP
jgi:formylglycine-generating enzyme required for sulfatase activity